MIIRELITKLGFKTDQAALNKANKGFSNLKQNMLLIGGIAAGAVAALNKAIQPAVDLQDSLRDALILTGKTGEEFKRLDKEMTDAAQDLSDELGVSAQEIAVGFYQVLSTGAEAMSPQFDAVAKTAIKFAKTINLSVAESVERVNDTLNAFGLEATQAEHVADVFFNTSKKAAVTVPQLADAMREVAPQAADLGITLEQTAAVLASMAEKGEKGARAGTALKIILSRLSKPPTEAAKALRKMGVRVFEANGKMRDFIEILKDMQKATKTMTDKQKSFALGAIAGQEGISKLSGVLRTNLDITEDWVRSNEDAADALDLAYRQRMDTAKRSTDALWHSIKNLLSEGIQPFLDDINESLKDVKSIVVMIREWVEANEKLITTLRIIYQELQKFSPGRFFQIPFDLLKEAAKKVGIGGGAEPGASLQFERRIRKPSLTRGLGAGGFAPAISPEIAARAAMIDQRQQNRITMTFDIKPSEGMDELRLANMVGNEVEKKLGPTLKFAQEDTN